MLGTAFRKPFIEVDERPASASTLALPISSVRPQSAKPQLDTINASTSLLTPILLPALRPTTTPSNISPMIAVASSPSGSHIASSPSGPQIASSPSGPQLTSYPAFPIKLTLCTSPSSSTGLIKSGLITPTNPFLGLPTAGAGKRRGSFSPGGVAFGSGGGSVSTSSLDLAAANSRHRRGAATPSVGGLALLAGTRNVENPNTPTSLSGYLVCWLGLVN